MKSPKWMRARKEKSGLPGVRYDVSLDGYCQIGFPYNFLGYLSLKKTRYLASALGLKVKGDLKKSIKSGLIEFRRK